MQGDQRLLRNTFPSDTSTISFSVVFMAPKLNFISFRLPKNHSPTTFWYFTIKINLISFRRGFSLASEYAQAVIENLCWSITASNPNSLPARHSPMFLQLDTVVECYLITNFFLSFNFTSLPYHVVWNATFMNFWWWLFPFENPALPLSKRNSSLWSRRCYKWKVYCGREKFSNHSPHYKWRNEAKRAGGVVRVGQRFDEVVWVHVCRAMAKDQADAIEAKSKIVLCEKIKLVDDSCLVVLCGFLSRSPSAFSLSTLLWNIPYHRIHDTHYLTFTYSTEIFRWLRGKRESRGNKQKRKSDKRFIGRKCLINFPTSEADVWYGYTQAIVCIAENILISCFPFFSSGKSALRRDLTSSRGWKHEYKVHHLWQCVHIITLNVIVM